MANEVNNPNEIAHAQIGVSVAGAEEAKQKIASLIDDLQKLEGAVGKVTGGATGGAAAPAAGGGGGGAAATVTGAAGASGGGGGGLAGLTGSLRSFLGLIGIGGGVFGIKAFVQDLIAANVQLEQMRNNVTNLNQQSIGLRGAGADLRTQNLANLTGVPEALLRPQSQGPAQRAAREAIGKASDEALAAFNAVNNQRANADRITDQLANVLGPLGMGGVARGLSNAASGRFFASNGDVDAAQSRMIAVTTNAQLLEREARRADQIELINQVRKMGSSQRR